MECKTFTITYHLKKIIENLVVPNVLIYLMHKAHVKFKMKQENHKFVDMISKIDRQTTMHMVKFLGNKIFPR